MNTKSKNQIDSLFLLRPIYRRRRANAPWHRAKFFAELREGQIQGGLQAGIG
jgi:hypothetical protein